MRRLAFAPDVKQMQVTDVKNGRFVFRPKPGQPVSLPDLEKYVTKAGYQIERSRIAVRGVLTPEGALRVAETGQVFRLVGPEKLRDLQARGSAGSPVTASGAWETRQGGPAILLGEPGPGEKKP